MGRIFTVLLSVVLVLILVVSAGVYWISSVVVVNTKEQAANEVAKSVSLSVSEQIYLLNKGLDTIAQQPEVIAALSSADPALLESTAKNIQAYFPEAIKIRLLTPAVSKIDESSTPTMGYADLDMVHETLVAHQLPVVQGDSGPNRHLAMTSPVKRDDQVIGVILASLDYSFITKAIKAIDLSSYYIELKQSSLVLGSSGVPLSKSGSASGEIKVPHTLWRVYYEYPVVASLGEMGGLLGLILSVISTVVLAFFLSYRKLSKVIKDDLSSVLKAFKDIIGHNTQGSYPASLDEMSVIIASFLRLNRALGDTQGHVKDDKDDKDYDEELEKNGFFSTPDNFGIADMAFTQVSMVEKSYPPITSASSRAETEYDVLSHANSTQNVFKTEHVAPTQKPDAVLRAESVTASTVSSGSRKSGIFKAYDIRGIVGRTLTINMVYDIGRALGTEARKYDSKTVVVGHDGRTSSPAIAEELAKGIAATGCDVMDIGMVPTPLLYFATQHVQGHCGVMVTGSHNPPEYNGFKMVIAGETLADGRIQALKTCIDNRAYVLGEMGFVEKNTKLSNEYIGTIAEDVRIARPMLIVLDCGNGVGGKLGPILLRTLGCEVIELNCEIDGSFPNHHPDPSKPENMQELITAVKHYKADLGIAFDGDADRLGVVDSSGKIIWPDRQMMLFAKSILADKIGAEVIYDVKCSKHLATQIKKYGGRPVMWKSGHSLMKGKIKSTGAKLAGEMSGHIFFNDRWFGFDDALYAASRLIEILSNEQGTSAQVFSGFPEGINTPELIIELADDDGFAVIEQIRSAADFNDATVIDLDGLRVEFSDGWGLVRASNTTPALTLRFEGDTLEALQIIQQRFKKLIESVKPDLEFPF